MATLFPLYLTACKGEGVQVFGFPPTLTPTNTQRISPSPTRTPGPATLTPTRTRTATATSPAGTPTSTFTSGPSPTPTTPFAGLGIRAFGVAPRPGSSFFSTGLLGQDVSTTDWRQATLFIQAGEIGPDGIVPVSLVADATVAFRVIDNSVVCFRLLAEGSTGTIDCDGGSAHDVLLTVDSHGTDEEGPIMLLPGQGEDAGPGALTLLVMQQGANLPAGSTLADCLTADFGEPELTAYTTAAATGRVTNPRQGGNDVTLARSGTNFSCDGWTSQEPFGALVNPILGIDTQVGDTVQVLKLGEQESAETPPPTPTRVVAPTPTPGVGTPTATPMAGAGLGQRSFSVAPRPGSSFFSSALFNQDVSTTMWGSATLVLSAGEVGPDGVAPLSLAEDAVIAFQVLDNSIVCFRLLAAGSGGSIDCNGGSAFDTELSVNSNGTDPEDPPVFRTGLGSDAGPGAAVLLIMRQGANLPAGSSLGDCQTADFGEPEETAFTTARSTITIMNPRQGGTVTQTQPGSNFSCDGWTTKQPLGAMVSPVLGLDTTVGDTGNLLKIGER